jgi:hypothetical protein
MKWKGCRQEWRSAVCAGLYFSGFWESWGLGSDGFYVVYASTCHIYIYTHPSYSVVVSIFPGLVLLKVMFFFKLGNSLGLYVS